jgi:hypothetical protein
MLKWPNWALQVVCQLLTLKRVNMKFFIFFLQKTLKGIHDSNKIARSRVGFSVDVHSREFLKILNYDVTDDQANYVTILSLYAVPLSTLLVLTAVQLSPNSKENVETKKSA